MSWEDSFQPENNSTGWQSSFVPLQGQQSAGQPEANGEGQAPGNANISGNQQTSPMQNMYDRFSDKPGMTYGSILPFAHDEKTDETSLAYPEVIRSPMRGLAELMAGTAGERRPVSDTQATQPGNLSSDALGTLAMMSPTTVGASKNLVPYNSGSQSSPGTLNELISRQVNDMSTDNWLKGPATALTSADAKATANQLYKKANDLGGLYHGDLTNKIISEAENLAPQTEAGKAVIGETPVTQMINRLQAIKDKPLSLPEIQEIDEHLGDLADAEYGMKGLSKQGRQFLELQSSLRDITKNASETEALGGPEGYQALVQGRKAYAQAMKMKDLERIQTRAELSDNPATTIKSGIRTLMSNDKRMRGYSDEEIAALKNAADRGLLGGTFHVFGSRLFPLGAALAGSFGGPVGALMAGGISQAGSSMMRNTATSMQTNKLNNAMKFLGSKVPLSLDGQ